MGQRKVIVTCAVTGSLHTPSMSPHLPMCTQNALLGGNVGVGLEDNLNIAKGELATSNAQQVEKIVRIPNKLGYGLATPGEARDRLALKGAGQVKF